jgi:hypothetical protein
MPLHTSNIRFIPTDTEPAGAHEESGSVYYDTSEEQLKHYDGSVWVPVRDPVGTAVLAGLHAWYKAAGETDSSGNGYNGTYGGTNAPSSTTFSTGPWGGSKEVTVYADTYSYCSLPLATIITGDNSRTITCWAKPGGTVDSSNYLFGFGYCETPYGRTFNGRMGNEDLGFMGCGTDYDPNLSGEVFITDAWVRVWYTYDGTDVKTYYTTNGTINLRWSQAFTLNTNAGEGDAIAVISGHASQYPHMSSYCTMRDFRIYNRVLTTTEMGTMWQE